MENVDISRPYPLTWGELLAYQPVNRHRPANRYFCPVHGGDNQCSLHVDMKHPQHHFHCHNCGVWGYLELDTTTWKPNKPPPRIKAYQHRIERPAQTEVKVANIDFELLKHCQQALPGSPGERYLKARGISLETAMEHGLGYSHDGRPLKPWKWGRIIAPHSMPDGSIISLYGRAIDGITDKQAPKGIKHDHLLGATRGVFNARLLKEIPGRPDRMGIWTPALFICEGLFDALTLIEAGYPAVAMFGLNGIQWENVDATELIFCLDADTAGKNAFKEQADKAALGAGKEVYRFQIPEGCKDINEAWINGRLNIKGQMDKTDPTLHWWLRLNYKGVVIGDRSTWQDIDFEIEKREKNR